MGKNDARSHIPAPVLTPAHDSVPPAVGDVVPPVPPPARPQYTPPPQSLPVASAEAMREAGPSLADQGRAALADDIRLHLQKVPAISELAARAITDGAGMAREYAAAAGELCRTANTNPQAGKNVRRLLRLALAHLET